VFKFEILKSLAVKAIQQKYFRQLQLVINFLLFNIWNLNLGLLNHHWTLVQQVYFFKFLVQKELRNSTDASSDLECSLIGW